jgi:Arc/MetJ-type ribon-helix-helix transcriptional regulator
MKTMTIRLPDALASEIEAESRRRKLSKSDVVRERLGVPAHTRKRSSASIDAIADLIGSVDGLARNLSGKKKKYLKSTGYGRNRSR